MEQNQNMSLPPSEILGLLIVVLPVVTASASDASVYIEETVSRMSHGYHHLFS